MMVKTIKSYFEQISEMIHNHPDVIEWLNNGNVVEIMETDAFFSVFAYEPQQAPIFMEMIGSGCTWIVSEQKNDDCWTFKIHTSYHCEYDDPDYSEDNQYDCRNCQNFYLLNGCFYYCNKCARSIMDPLMDECYAENRLKKDVK